MIEASTDSAAAAALSKLRDQATSRCNQYQNYDIWDTKSPLEGIFRGHVRLQSPYYQDGQSGILIEDLHGKHRAYYETEDIARKLKISGTNVGDAIRIQFIGKNKTKNGRHVNVFDVRSSPVAGYMNQAA